MAQRYDHLILPKVKEEFERKTREQDHHRHGYEEAIIYLFSLELKFKEDFENRRISVKLRNIFAENMYPLSEISRIEVSKRKGKPESECEWRIIDERKEYVVTEKKPDLQVFKKRDKNEFFTAKLKESESIQQAFERQQIKFNEYLDPSLIFKINVNQNVWEDNFRNDLGRAGVKVISPSPDNKGYWIIFAEDKELQKFKRKLEDYAQHDKYAFFNAIDGIAEIPPEEKIEELLRKEPFSENEISYIDVEIWRMENDKLEKFREGFINLVDKRNGETCDEFLAKDFYLLRIKTDKQLLEDILELREVAHVDRPPRIAIETALATDIKELKVSGSPLENAAGILVVDSGILPGHPLLENAVGECFAVPTTQSSRIREDAPFDDVGHGTNVAGVALYGDIQQCINNKAFKPEIWIFSAKVMFKDESGKAAYDEEELLEHQLDTAVRRIAENYQNCKVINLSLGNTALRMFKGKRQFRLAAQVDDLSKELNLIFVISAGNYRYTSSEVYPDCLLERRIDKAKITDPATSALAISVGALCWKPRINALPGTCVEHPSPITRVGPGYKGMIKPEVVENGGGGFGDELDVVTINHDWIKDGRLFTLVYGTSFSAPKISNYFARLINKYPDKSPNMIKALLLSSASIPSERPPPLDSIELDSNASSGKLNDLLNVYGYGKPSFDRALFSESNHVLLTRESTIKPDQCHFYAVYLPDVFLEVKGRREISVTLMFDPPTNRNRIDYFGVTMETHLFKNIEIEDVVRAFSRISTSEEEDADESLPSDIKKNEIKLYPHVRLRKRGVHQKGIRVFSKKPKINKDCPLVLVVICQKRWVLDNYEQNYAVIVSIKHSKAIDLYNEIRLRNKERVTIPLRE